MSRRDRTLGLGRLGPGPHNGRVPGSQRVVIVGGGFGGLACARALDGADAGVTLLDRHNYHLFTPLLYQVATALLDPSDIAFPLRRAFRKSPNVRFRQATVTGVDLDARTVRTHAGDEIGYDTLVFATGGTNNYFGNEPLAEHSIGMKTLPEAMRLRNHVLSCLEEAEQTRDTDEKQSGARIVLVEGLDRLLGAFHPKLGRYAEETLRRFGIEVRTQALVEKADDASVTLRSGEIIHAKTIVWSAGVRPSDPLNGAPRARSKRLEADEFLRLRGRDDVFVIGDAASVATPRGELPMLSPPAMQEGRYVARAIKTGRSTKPFHYLDKGTMATIGRHAAVADVRGVKLKGSLGWLAWLFVHIYYLIGFRNRVAVLASWGWNYFLRDRPIRLIVRGDPDPLADEIDQG
ncbi:MAG: NAD(P)/FAD-dependent oxidoreductase [Actinobacteria bacterium]|nr:MAG: NAD(P)/FAD-dependent oxidoreductase [Actinomycetota bacterium]